jgi:DNA repair protein RadA
VAGYLKDRFGYSPTVRTDRRRENPVYTILIREATVGVLGGLENTSSETKFVPESVLSGKPDIVAGFVAGYLDGDGFIGRLNAEAITKSKKLCTGVAYLLMRLGISATVKEKRIGAGRYHRLFIVGRDRGLLNLLPLKEKSASFAPKRSAYGYSGKVVEFLQEVYKTSLGGSRGRFAKPVGRKENSGDAFYHYLVQSSYCDKSMNEGTLVKVVETFCSGRERMDSAIGIAERLETATHDEFLRLHGLLPFAFKSIAEKVGLSKSGLRNYVERGLPETEMRQRIKAVLLDELRARRERLDFGLKTIKNLLNFNFDEIEAVREVDYNDYVYDFVVPEGHSFIGGGMPTILHNTQITHQLSVNVQLPKEKGGLEGKALYIDTEGTFRPERIVQMAKAVGIDPDEALANIKVGKAYNSDHQMLLAEKAEQLIKEENIKLIIVDSLMGHFRSEYVGRGTLADRQQKLNRHLAYLMKVADTYNIPVVITNQVMASPGILFGDPTEPIGGHVLAHKSTFRVYLRRGKGEKRVAKLVDSPHLPDSECIFSISEDGVRD